MATDPNRLAERKNTQAKDAGAMPLSTLTQTQAPARVTVAPPATQAEGLMGTIQEGAKSFLGELSAKREAAQTGRDQSYDMLLDDLLNQKGSAELTDRAYRREGVDDAEAELKDITNDILSEEVGLRRRLEKLDKNEQGLFGGGLEQEKDRVTRESLAKQADLAVIQLAKQGRYDSARAIADRYVQAQTERQKMRLDILRFNYEENKDLFTTAEQREFETKQKDRERSLEMEEFKEKARFQQVIDKEMVAYRNAFEGGGSDEISLTSTDKQVLLSANFTASEISQIQKDVSQYGLSTVLEGIADPAQKKAIQRVYSGTEGGVTLDRATLASFYGYDETSTKQDGFLGLWGKTDAEKLDEVEAAVKRYRALGLSESEIRTKLLAK